MTYEEYVAQQRLILAGLLVLLLVILAPFRLVGIGLREWQGLLAALYPHVENARRESAGLARRFYDGERERRTGLTAPHPIYLAPYRPEWFEEAMGAVARDLSREESTDGAVARAISVVFKEVENGGRKTVLRAVESDPVVKGWARVEGGGESCAFCTMLISRGPVYQSAAGAGLDVDETTAVELWRQVDTAPTDQAREAAEAVMDELRTRWHLDCDCKVVPVFDRRSWTGRDAYLDAKQLWADVTKGYSGLGALNALRRALYSRDSDDSVFDIAA